MRYRLRTLWAIMAALTLRSRSITNSTSRQLTSFDATISLRRTTTSICLGGRCAMRIVSFIAVGCCLIWLSLTAFGHAQTVEGDILRGQAAFLRDASWYNLKAAEANSVNVDATTRWKRDLRKIQHERDLLEVQKKYEKTKNIEQLKQQIAQREQELRINPSPNDVQSGAALNSLVYDLTDPDITSYRWSASSIAHPTGASIKELVFSFTPNNTSTQASIALSRGVIALSRLDIKDKWPALLKKDELATERKAYEDAYVRVRDKVLRGDYAVDEILALDATLDALRRKIATEIPIERGFRTQATRFVDDLRDATRMFDANSVDYAREILTDTKDHDATTVRELVEFMSKYRLRFTNSDRSPTARVLYAQIYEALRKQLEALGIKPEAAASPPVVAEDDKAAAKLTRTVPAQRTTGAYEPIGNPGILPVDADGKPLNLSFESGLLENWK